MTAPQPPQEHPEEGPHQAGQPHFSRPPADPFGDPAGPYPQPGYGPPPGGAPGGVAIGQGQHGNPPVTPAEERTWGMLSHVGLVLTGFVAPLIIWAVYQNRSPWIRANAATALNFGILASIGYLVSAVLSLVLIGYLTWLAIAIVVLVFGIQGAVKANQGRELPRYGFNVSWVK